jgi:hypothetical protein
MPAYVGYTGFYVPMRKIHGSFLFQDQAVRVRHGLPFNARAELGANIIFKSAPSFASHGLWRVQQYFRSGR